MFGTIRLFLAALVVVGHLGNVAVGEWAVPLFFLISGYLMTAVMHGSYGYNLSGVRRFFKSRALRILPPYWIATALVLIVYLVGANGSLITRPTIHVPDTLGQIAQVVSLATLTPWSKCLPLQPAWSLAVEEIFYAWMAFGASKTLGRTLVWLAFALALWVLNVDDDPSFNHRYFTAWGAAPWFALGALAWFGRGRCGRRVAAGAALGALAIWAWATFSHIGIVRMYGWPIFAFMALCAVVITEVGPLRAPKWDRALGDLSYPVYLLHWPVGAAVAYALGVDIGIKTLIVSLPIVVGLSFAMDRWVSRPIDKIRDRLRRDVASSTIVVEHPRTLKFVEAS